MALAKIQKIEIDHKDGRENNLRVSDIATQKF